METAMTIVLSPLPYAQDALAPHISADTLATHHGKHHKAYVDKVHAAIEGTDLAGKSLEDIIHHDEGAGNKGHRKSTRLNSSHQCAYRMPSSDRAKRPTDHFAASTKPREQHRIPQAITQLTNALHLTSHQSKQK